MQPYRLILCTHIWSDGLSTRPDGQNSFTLQSASTTDVPRDPPRIPVICNPYCTQPVLMLHLRLLLHLHSRNFRRCCGRHEHAAALRSCPLPHLIQSREPCHWHRHLRIIQLFWLDLTKGFLWYLTQFLWTWSDPRFAAGFDSVLPNWFDSRFSTGFDSHFPRFDSIQLMFNAIIFDLSHIISFTPQSVFRESHIGQGVLEIIQHWNRGIFHNSDRWTFFSKNTL